MVPNALNFQLGLIESSFTAVGLEAEVAPAVGAAGSGHVAQRAGQKWGGSRRREDTRCWEQCMLTRSQGVRDSPSQKV